MNLIDSLITKNKENLDTTAIVYYNNFRIEKSYTYKELFVLIENRKNKYVEFKAQGFALFCIENPFEFLINFFALVACGVKPVPIAPPSMGLNETFIDRIKHLNEFYSFDFVIADDKNHAYFSEFKIPVLSQNTMSAHIVRTTPELHNDSCFIQFSSGSTAEPKGIVITHEKILNNLKQITSAIDVVEQNRILTWLPLYHDMGLIGGVLSAFYVGWTLHLMSPQDYIGNTDRYLELVEKNKIAFLLGPDFMFRQISREIFREKKVYDLSHLKICMSGAELVLPSTVEMFDKALIKSSCLHSVQRPVYGMAEACLGVTFSLIKNNVHNLVVSCGKPLNGIQVQIFNEAKIHESDELFIGEIGLKGPNFFTEYYMNKYELPLTLDGYYLTGDEGYLFNSELYPLGRKKNVIIINGQKFHSVDLEKHLFENLRPLIGRVACVQDTATYVVAEIPWIYYFIAPYIRIRISQVISLKIPVTKKNIILVPKYDLPRTSSGKLQRFKVIEKIKSSEYVNSFYFFQRILHLMKNFRKAL